MAPKRKADSKTSQVSKPKRHKPQDQKTEENRKVDESDGDGDDSDPDYEPSAAAAGSSSDTGEDSDSPTSSDTSSGDDDDIDNDSDKTSDDDDDDDDDDESSDSSEEDEKAVVGREVAGKVLRVRPEESKALQGQDTDNLKLTDLAYEILLLDAPHATTGLCRAASIKGRVFLAGDRVHINNNSAEVVGFSKAITTRTTSTTTTSTESQSNEYNIHVKWLVNGGEAAGMGVWHGNYIRCEPAIVVKYTSETEVEHIRTDVSTCKITHVCTGLSQPTFKSTLDAIKSAISNKTFLTEAVLSDKGRWRPLLFGVDRRWNAGEQKRLFIFLRRVWPSCARPASVTIPLRPAPHKDNLAAPDDNADDVRDIAELTAKYYSIWDTVVKRTDDNANSCQRWLANTYDSWRRLYLTIKHTDWETASREFTATSNIILHSLLPPITTFATT
jgi:hypothetical protein